MTQLLRLLFEDLSKAKVPHLPDNPHKVNVSLGVNVVIIHIIIVRCQGWQICPAIKACAVFHFLELFSQA